MTLATAFNIVSYFTTGFFALILLIMVGASIIDLMPE